MIENTVVVDIETLKLADEVGGWGNLLNFGLGCAVTYSYQTHDFNVFLEKDIEALKSYLNNHNRVVSFNGYKFDLPIIYQQNPYNSTLFQSFDILRKLWSSIGLNPDEFNKVTHGGYGLDAVCYATIGMTKNGQGSLAPQMLRDGKLGAVISYCIHDVKMTCKLYEFIIRYGYVISPKTSAKLPILNLSM